MILIFSAELSSALQLLAAGKRNFLVSDVNGAVECLADACQKFGEYYGEGAKECGDAYFYYGKALLELARMENGVIDKAMDGGKIGSPPVDGQVYCWRRNLLNMIFIIMEESPPRLFAYLCAS